MHDNQRIVLVITAALFLLMTLFPPTDVGFKPIWNMKVVIVQPGLSILEQLKAQREPKYRRVQIDLKHLAVLYFGVAIVTGLVFLAVKPKDTEQV